MADFRERDVVPTTVEDAYFVYPSANREEQAEMIANDKRKLSPKALEEKSKEPKVDDVKPNGVVPDDSSTNKIQSNDAEPEENSPDDSKPNLSEPKENVTDEDRLVKSVECLKLDNSDDRERNQGDDEDNYIGKWMLFLDQCEKDENGHTQHDRAWFKIDDLYSDGKLYFAKASTALKSELAHTSSKGCICCYTKDYRDEADVRTKADLVRRALEEDLQETVIYYKTDSATLANKYRVLGSGRVSIYRHKPDYSFWKTSADNTSWDIIRKKNRFQKFSPRSISSSIGNAGAVKWDQ